ncbi:MAG TPA: serine/threonine-protein kinase, partial [Polyangia bacterium]
MSKFGQYQLFDRIAVGGMAEVFRGRAAGEEGFEKAVAIKRILPAFARDGRFVSMLVTEARIHSALTHRNIVQIHDLGVSQDGEYFIVLEYVDGHDLSSLLTRLNERRARGTSPGQLSDAVAVHIAIELGEGIHFAHELRGPDGQPLGLVHRDISPSNVLLSYAGEVKLSDFGLAKRQTDHSVVGSLKGK